MRENVVLTRSLEVFQTSPYYRLAREKDALPIVIDSVPEDFEVRLKPRRRSAASHHADEEDSEDPRERMLLALQTAAEETAKSMKQDTLPASPDTPQTLSLQFLDPRSFEPAMVFAYLIGSMLRTRYPSEESPSSSEADGVDDESSRPGSSLLAHMRELAMSVNIVPIGPRRDEERRAELWIGDLQTPLQQRRRIPDLHQKRPPEAGRLVSQTVNSLRPVTFPVTEVEDDQRVFLWTSPTIAIYPAQLLDLFILREIVRSTGYLPNIWYCRAPSGMGSSEPTWHQVLLYKLALGYTGDSSKARRTNRAAWRKRQP